MKTLLKYFLYELHVAQNTDNISEQECNKIENQWQLNIEKYQEIYKALKDRLPIEVFKHFNSWGFHDYRLIKMEIEHKSLLQLNVHFTLSNDEEEENEELWILSFHNVSILKSQHHNFDNEKSILSRDIDSWLYEEFLPVNASTLSFEVIFSSGGNVLVHFLNHSVSIKRIK